MGAYSNVEMQGWFHLAYEVNQISQMLSDQFKKKFGCTCFVSVFSITVSIQLEKQCLPISIIAEMTFAKGYEIEWLNSLPIVVGAPWPGRTLVSGGSSARRVREVCISSMEPPRSVRP